MTEASTDPAMAVPTVQTGSSVQRAAAIQRGRSYRPVWYALLVIGLLQAAWSGAFIAASSPVIEGQRYFCLLDDAMISLRYAANWAAGHGLVWNPGERVEGYTNFGWTLVLGLLHWLPISPSGMCLLAQLLGIPVLWGILLATVRLARACGLPPAEAIIALIWTGGFYNLLFFPLAGMETGLVVFFTTLALAECVRSLRGRRGSLACTLWFLPVMLTRPDALALLLFVTAFMLLAVRHGRWRIICGFLAVAAAIGLQSLWRYSYYGDWLPNTYYLKATGWPLAERLGPGLRHTFWTAVTLAGPLLLALVTLTRRNPRHVLILGTFAVAASYQLYVGGDVWPLSRFVLPVCPALFVLAAEGLRYGLRLFLERGSRNLIPRYRLVTTLVLLVAINAINLNHWLLLSPPQIYGQSRRQIRDVIAVARVAAPEATVAVAFAGTFPYFSKRYCVDIWGKCEPHIARLPAFPGANLAGHVKRDLGYIIEKYQPDIILHTIETQVPAMVRDYQPVLVEVDGTQTAFSVRLGSPHVHGGRPISWQHAADILNLARANELRK